MLGFRLCSESVSRTCDSAVRRLGVQFARRSTIFCLFFSTSATPSGPSTMAPSTLPSRKLFLLVIGGCFGTEFMTSMCSYREARTRQEFSCASGRGCRLVIRGRANFSHRHTILLSTDFSVAPPLARFLAGLSSEEPASFSDVSVTVYADDMQRIGLLDRPTRPAAVEHI